MFPVNHRNGSYNLPPPNTGDMNGLSPAPPNLQQNAHISTDIPSPDSVLNSASNPIATGLTEAFIANLQNEVQQLKDANSALLAGTLPRKKPRKNPMPDSEVNTPFRILNNAYPNLNSNKERVWDELTNVKVWVWKTKVEIEGGKERWFEGKGKTQKVAKQAMAESALTALDISWP